VKIPLKAILFIALTILFTLLLGWIQQNSEVVPAWVILPQLAPGLAAWLMLGIFRDQKMILAVPEVHHQWWKFAAALLIPLGLAGLQFLIYQQLHHFLDVPPLRGTGFLILLSWMFVGAFAEELGWRGYLQPLLAGKLNGLLTSLVVGSLWGLWHFGNYQQGSSYMIFFLLSTVAYSTVITWLIRDAGWNVILPLFVHLAVNMGYYVFSSVLSDPRYMRINGLVWVGAAFLVVILQWKFFMTTSDETE